MVRAPPAVRARCLGMRNLVSALRLVWRSGSGLMVASICVVGLQAVVPLIPLYLTRLIVNAIADGAEHEYVLMLVAAAGLATAVSMALRGLASYVREAQGLTLSDYVQSLIHRKSLEVDLDYYEGPSFFDKLHRAQEEAPYRPAAVVENLMVMLRSSLSLAGIVGILIYVLPWYALAALALASLPLGVVRLVFSRRYFRRRMQRTANERHVMYLNWLLTNRDHAKELRIFGLSPLLSARSEQRRSALRKERIRLAAGRSAAEVGSYLIQTGAVFGVVAVVALNALRGDTTLGDLVMLLQAVQRGQTLVGELLGGANGLYESKLFLAAVFEFLGLKPSIEAPEAPLAPPQQLERGIELEHVYFAYPNTERLVIEDVSMHVGPNEIVALVGDNGAGKTTLMKLVCRFYDPTQGAVMVDGTDLRAMHKQDWWSRVTALFQDPGQYYYTVRENVWFGLPDRAVDQQGIEAATQRAQAHEFIQKLPERYETPLGRFLKEGAELSGGQWKKLALSRAFYRDSPVAILDEPTSGVDPESEARLLQTLRQWAQDKSVLLVTHRVAAARIADRVYVMRDGRIAEHGSHDELCAREGIYERMYRMQLEQIQGKRS